ncbi:MAG TPA: geranylgeranylglyceryl/heptaprenylglyceryl phosphate synthase [Cyclobacteriaceae bacterium]|nr:geranylgeranylglyceryl/heptaprenylglyceryl phosphate synthase [Cyclobacteriaceae bacterium]
MKAKAVREKFHYFHTSGKKAVALLIDPDAISNKAHFIGTIEQAVLGPIDFFFLGGSLATRAQCYSCVEQIKFLNRDIPVVIFPGNAIQVVENADAILFLSLISGRNPEFLIGQQVIAAPYLAQSDLEVLPTGYMLIDSGQLTSVNYMSQTIPLPSDKPALAVATALAGTMLGMSHLYLDAGSGAKRPVPKEIIAAVKNHTHCPLIVGGGIDTVAKAKAAWTAGADVVVLGNGVEKNPSLLTEVLSVAQMYNLSLNVN